MNRSSKKNNGFTLIELVIVVAILAILVGLLAPSYTKYVKKSKVTKCETQRNEIEKAYQIACIEDSELASIGDTMSTEPGKKDPVIKRLEELGYFKSEEARCPVYKEDYKVIISTDKSGITAIEVQCSCVNNLLSYIDLANKTYSDIYIKGKPYNRENLINEFYNKLGRLPEVSNNLKKGTKYEDFNKPIYWRPYNIDENTMIMYAAGTTSGANGWGAGLLYINGKVYQDSTPVTDRWGHMQYTNISDIYTIGNDTYPTLDDWLEKKGFKLV